MKSCVVAVYKIVDAVVVLARTNRTKRAWIEFRAVFSQPPGRGPVPGPGINYTGPREA